MRSPLVHLSQLTTTCVSALASVTTALQAATKLSEAAAGVKPNIEAFKTPEVDKAFTTAVKAVSDSYKEYGVWILGLRRSYAS